LLYFLSVYICWPPFPCHFTYSPVGKSLCVCLHTSICQKFNFKLIAFFVATALGPSSSHFGDLKMMMMMRGQVNSIYYRRASTEQTFSECLPIGYNPHSPPYTASLYPYENQTIRTLCVGSNTFHGSCKIIFA